MSSTNSKLSKGAQSSMLKNSMQQGLEGSFNAEAGIGYASVSTSVGGSKNSAKDAETEREVAREISSAAE